MQAAARVCTGLVELGYQLRRRAAAEVVAESWEEELELGVQVEVRQTRASV
jgi:hypothetical protein